MAEANTAHIRTGLWRRRSRFEWREILWGLIFLSPWFIGLAGFTLLPIVSTLYFSFTDYNMVRPNETHLVGLANYARLFSDPQVGQSMLVTIRFAFIAVPLGLIVPLLFAVLVNSKHLIAANVYRTPALNLLGLWGVGNSMLILLAALQGVPTELYEAAIVDGANAVQRFFRITIPMISPVIFYNVTLGVIFAFQYFVVALLIGGRNGDPNGATLFFNLHLYRTGFVFNEMGYASTLAWVLFLIVMTLTVLLFTIGQRFVYYASPDS